MDQPILQATVMDPVSRDEERALERVANQPGVPLVRFSGRAKGWPPTPVGKIADTPMVKELPEAMDEELGLAAHRQALADRRVQEALGERFVHLTTYQLPSPKEPEAAAALPIVRLTFFSYTARTCVEVDVHDGHVQEITNSPGYQPPISSREIDDAISLLESRRGVKATISGLQPRAILIPAQSEQVGYRNRSVWLTFFDTTSLEEEQAPVVAAAIDLVARRVLFVSSSKGARRKDRSSAPSRGRQGTSSR